MSRPSASTHSPETTSSTPSRQLRDEGLTVLYTTHYMEEADRLCDRLAIMDHGQIVVMGTPHELKSEIGDPADCHA